MTEADEHSCHPSEPDVLVLTTREATSHPASLESARFARVALDACWRSHGMVIAIAARMAAVLCMIFLPLVFCALFLIGSMGGPLSIGTMLAGTTFVLLASGLVVGALKLSKGWEEERLD